MTFRNKLFPLYSFSINYTAATERCPVDGRNDGARYFSHLYYHIPLQPPLHYDNRLKVFTASEGHHVVSTINTRVKKMGKRLEGNRGKYTLGTYGGGRSMGLDSVASV